MEALSQKDSLRVTGMITVRSHPAGTIEQLKTLHEMGRHDDANLILNAGKLEVEQKNLIVDSANYGIDILVQFLVSGYNGGFGINNGTSLTGTTDGVTAVITGFSSTSTISPGMNISGAGIPPYSTVVSIDSSSSITISQNTTAGGTVPLYFSQQNQLGITWGEIGTGDTAPASTDVALTTPTNRAAVSYAYDSGFNTSIIQFFFPDAVLANTSYYECGSFVGGGSTIGSGNMFNHALFASAYTKTAGTDTTLAISISIANS